MSIPISLDKGTDGSPQPALFFHELALSYTMRGFAHAHVCVCVCMSQPVGITSNFFSPHPITTSFPLATTSTSGCAHKNQRPLLGAQTQGRGPKSCWEKALSQPFGWGIAQLCFLETRSGSRNVGSKWAHPFGFTDASEGSPRCPLKQCFSNFTMHTNHRGSC